MPKVTEGAKKTKFAVKKRLIQRKKKKKITDISPVKNLNSSSECTSPTSVISSIPDTYNFDFDFDDDEHLYDTGNTCTDKVNALDQIDENSQHSSGSILCSQRDNGQNLANSNEIDISLPTFIPSNKGKKSICFVNGFCYNQERSSDDVIYWKCRR